MKIDLKKKLSKVRKKKKLMITLTAAALAVVITGTVVLRNAGSGNALASESATMSATVENSDLSTTIEGTGTLENGDTEIIQMPGGVKIDEVNVSAGDEVKAGDVLATVNEISLNAELYSAKEQIADLKDDISSADSGTAEYYELLNQKANLEEKYTVLKKIAKKNTFTAPTDGVVTTVNVSDGSTGESTDTDNSGNTGTEQMSINSANSTVPNMIALNTAETVMAAESSEESAVSAEAAAQVTEVNKITSLGISRPAAGEKPDSSIIETDSYTGTIKWSSNPSVFKYNKAYTATVTLTAKAGYRFAESISAAVEGAVISSKKVSSEEEKNKLALKIIYDKTEKEQDSSNAGTAKQDGTAQQREASDNASSAGVSSGISAGTSTGMVSSTSGDSTTSSAASSTENDELITAFEIASGEAMALKVSVDELDVLAISEGQKAVLTLDAIEGEEFEGEITNINLNGTSNNGTTKYEVEIQVEKSSSMMSGMNASVSIVTEEKSNVLVLPSAAISEKGNNSFVYTKKDEETGELSGETQIETGSSDGTKVEITSGLSEGDTVYYEIADISDASEDMGEMPFGDMDRMMGGEGGNPGGGGMPSGDPPGGIPGNGGGAGQ